MGWCWVSGMKSTTKSSFLLFISFFFAWPFDQNPWLTLVFHMKSIWLLKQLVSDISHLCLHTLSSLCVDCRYNLNNSNVCPQVPVASVSSGVHEAGKNIDKTEALFSQERDPRFAEMYTSISGCTTHTHRHTNIVHTLHTNSWPIYLNVLFSLFSVFSIISIVVCVCVGSGR